MDRPARVDSLRKVCAHTVLQTGRAEAPRTVLAGADARHRNLSVAQALLRALQVRPCLWRFWRHLPGHSHITLFDRSWYGRVPVERVEGFCSEADWRRAYAEINDFESQLVESGIVLDKFWFAIARDEQLRRFEEREATPFKRSKITEEEWRNREKRELWERVVCDMVDRTSTEIAPWTLVEANSQYHSRVKVLCTLCEAIDGAP